MSHENQMLNPEMQARCRASNAWESPALPDMRGRKESQGKSTIRRASGAWPILPIHSCAMERTEARQDAPTIPIDSVRQSDLTSSRSLAGIATGLDAKRLSRSGRETLGPSSSRVAILSGFFLPLLPNPYPVKGNMQIETYAAQLWKVLRLGHARKQQSHRPTEKENDRALNAGSLNCGEPARAEAYPMQGSQHSEPCGFLSSFDSLYPYPKGGRGFLFAFCLCFTLSLYNQPQ